MFRIIVLMLCALATTPALADEPLRLVDVGAGIDVEKRALQGRAEHFTAELDRIYVHATLANTGAPQTVYMVWRHEGAERWRIPLEVGRSKRWRTWSRKRIDEREAGRWQVDVVDAGGAVLGSARFVVEEEPGC